MQNAKENGFDMSEIPIDELAMNMYLCASGFVEHLTVNEIADYLFNYRNT